MKHALTIAGSDCSGGAGIQADLKTFAAHGIYGMSAIVSVVAENTCRVLDIQDITPDMIEKQIIAVFEDIEVHAVKVGMLSTRAGMLAVSKMLKQYRPKHVVIDPVMVAKGGCALMQEEALSTLIEEMIPLADVLTPNIPEAEAITGMKIQSEEERKRAAVSIYQMGAKHVLIKGGHLSQKMPQICCTTAILFRHLLPNGFLPRIRMVRAAHFPPPLLQISHWVMQCRKQSPMRKIMSLWQLPMHWK